MLPRDDRRSSGDEFLGKTARRKFRNIRWTLIALLFVLPRSSSSIALQLSGPGFAVVRRGYGVISFPPWRGRRNAPPPPVCSSA